MCVHHTNSVRAVPVPWNRNQCGLHINSTIFVISKATTNSRASPVTCGRRYGNLYLCCVLMEPFVRATRRGQRTWRRARRQRPPAASTKTSVRVSLLVSWHARSSCAMWDPIRSWTVYPIGNNCSTTCVAMLHNIAQRCTAVRNVAQQCTTLHSSAQRCRVPRKNFRKLALRRLAECRTVAENILSVTCCTSIVVYCIHGFKWLDARSEKFCIHVTSSSKLRAYDSCQITRHVA